MIPARTGPALAILTVVRDDLASLRDTRASLRAQDRQDFAWIVVDGGSTDGTAAWLAAHDDELFWWRSAPDRGLYDAMNVALEAALRTGAESVLFLNAGDRLVSPCTVARLLAALEGAPHAGLLYGDALERLEDGRLIRKTARSHRLAVLGMFTHHQAMLYRSRAVADLRFDLRHGIAADYGFTLRILARSETAVRLPYPVCVFAPGGLSQRNARQGREEQTAIRRELLGMGFGPAAIIQALQWLALTIRCNLPGIYVKLRFSILERLFLFR